MRSTTKYNSHSVLLGWRGSAGATGYIIYRKTGKYGNFCKIGYAGSGTRKFLDKNVKPGQDYYYTVRAVCKRGSSTVLGFYDTYGIRAKI